MKVKKFTTSLILVLVLILSTLGSASAALSVEFEPNTAQVGDTVTLSIQASNTGLYDWYPVIIYVQQPSGLQFLSFNIPDKVRQDYDSSTGIWDVNRMRHDERGLNKQLIITYKVLPSAAGKTLTATARFQQLVIEATGTDITTLQPRASDTLTVSKSTKTPDPDPDPNPGPTGPNTGPGSGPGSALGSGIANALGNLTQSDRNNPLQSGGGGGGKTYEVSTNDTTENQESVYILAILLIIGLIVGGYFYGRKK